MKKVRGRPTQHACSINYGTAVGEDHLPNAAQVREPPSADILRINHYYSRSTSEYARKRARASPSDGRVRDTALLPPDEVRDDAILSFLPALRRGVQRP